VIAACARLSILALREAESQVAELLGALVRLHVSLDYTLDVIDSTLYIEQLTLLF